MRHRNYRPKTRSSQLNNVCTIIAAETEINAVSSVFVFEISVSNFKQEYAANLRYTYDTKIDE